MAYTTRTRENNKDLKRRLAEQNRNKTPWDFAADIVAPPPWEPPPGTPPLLKHQQPPPQLRPEQKNVWILEAGRGAGKTEACARYFAKWMHEHPGARGTIIAPTTGDAVEACITGPSGLQSIDPDVKWSPSAAGGAKVSWQNGSEALVVGIHKPSDVDRLRAGGNRGIHWYEEMAANQHLKECWDVGKFGLRQPPFPHVIASTTPRNTSEYRAIRSMENAIITKASLFDNPHLPKEFVEEMRKKYEGTRLGRQELRGELLDDIEGALWTRFMVEMARLDTKPRKDNMRMIVVAIDPAATSSETADDTGIVVVGWGVDGWGYVLEDLTCHLPPDGWAQRAVRAYHRWQADYIVGEINHGGEMVEAVIATAGPTVPFKPVRASRGKATRAQPVAALYGDGKVRPSRIKHAPGLMELEDQLCSWVPGEEESPDRLDAMVWGLTSLFLEEEETDHIIEDWTPEPIGADI